MPRTARHVVHPKESPCRGRARPVGGRWRDRHPIAWWRRRRHRGVDGAYWRADAVVAVDAAAFPGVWRVDIRGDRPQDRVDVPALNGCSGPRQILSFHGRSVTRPVGCSARALEARTAVQRRANRVVRSFACGRAGDSCESCRGQPHAAADDRVVPLGRLACPESGSAMLSRLAVQYEGGSTDAGSVAGDRREL